MKIALVVLVILVSKFCYSQENEWIGKYRCNFKDEFIDIISDSLIEFNVNYPSCLAMPLKGYGVYEIKRSRLFTTTSESNPIESNTEIYFKISREENKQLFIGPYFRKNLKYQNDMLKAKIHQLKFRFPWQWKSKHCPITPTKYEKVI